MNNFFKKALENKENQDLQMSFDQSPKFEPKKKENSNSITISPDQSPQLNPKQNNNFKIEVNSNKNGSLNLFNSMIKKENNEDKKFIFTEKMNQDLQKYFNVVLENQDVKEKLVLFNSLYEEHKENKDYIFFLFWYPFINSDELMSIEILNTTKIYFEEYVLENIASFKVSSKELNAYAFKCALKNNFDDKLLYSIIKQGKIRLSMEWILNQIEQRNISFIEECWKANNDCYFETTKLFDKFFEFYRDTLQFQIELTSEKNLEASNILKAGINNLLSKKNKNEKDKPQQNLKGNASGGNSSNNEFFELNRKNFGKLSLAKIILLFNFYNETYEDSIDADLRQVFENTIRAICIFDKDKKYSDNILEGLYLSKNQAIAEELLEANLLNVEIKVFLTALKYKDLRFCLQFYDRYSDFKIFDNDKLHDEIIEKIYEDLNNLEIYLFLIKNFSNYFKLNTMKTFVKKIEELLQSTNQSNRIINNFSNPMKIFVLIAEIFNRSKNRFPSLDSYVNRLIQKCLDYSENIQSLIEDDSVFRELLFEKDLKKRTLLDIISSNNFMILLKNKIIEKIVDDLWDGPYEIQGNFLEVSGQYRSLNINVGSKDYDIYTRQRKTAFSKNKVKYLSNFTHFRVWQKNIYSKYFVEVLIGLLLVVGTLVFSFEIIGDYKTILNYDKDLLNGYTDYIAELKPEDVETHKRFLLSSRNIFDKQIFDAIPVEDFSNEFDRVVNKTQDFNEILTANSVDKTTLKMLLGGQNLYRNFYYNIERLDYWKQWMEMIFTGFLLLPFEYILRVIYMIKVRQPNFGLTLYPDVLILIFSIVIKFVELDEDKVVKNILDNNSYDSIGNFDFVASFSTIKNLITTDPLNYELLALAIIAALIWVRFILLIRGTKTFGPLIVIFLVSLKGVLKYIILFLIVTYAYSSVAYMVFYRIGGYLYASPFYVFMYFYFLSLGGDSGYDSYYELSSEKGYIPYLGGLYMVLILILNVIVFFNLIIALLSNIFETYKNYSLQIYIQKKLEIRKKYYDDEERFNALLVSYFPLSVFTFPFSLALLFMVDEKRTKKLNNFIMYLNYSIYSIVYMITFTISTLILIPFSYLNIAYSKFIQIFVDEIQQYFKIYKIMAFFFFLCFGILFQVKTFITDIYSFFMELWKKNITLTTDAENRGKYSIKSSILEVMIRMINKIYEKPSAIQQKIKETAIMRKGDQSFLNSTKPDANENTVDPLSLKISLEKIIFVISKYVDPNMDNRTKEMLTICDYTLDKEKIKEKKEEKEEGEESTFNFNQNYQMYNKYFEKLGYNYIELLDYLLNFCDEKYVLDLPTLINILMTSYKFYQVKVFYMNISDKNVKNYTSKKQGIFFDKVDSLMKLDKKKSTKKSLVNGLNSEVNLNPNENEKSSNVQMNMNDNNEMKILNTVILNSINPSIVTSKANLKEEKKIKKKETKGKKYLRKIDKGKNLFKLPDYLSIPVITRQCIISFYDDLKEFQTDLSKKINENILKNQRYLDSIRKDLKERKRNENNKEQILGGFGNSLNPNQEQKPSTIKKFGLFDGIDRDVKNAENIVKVEKKSTNKGTLISNSKKKGTLINTSKISEGGIEARIGIFERKLNKLMRITEKLASAMNIPSSEEELDEDYSDDEENSENTVVIEKFENFNFNQNDI